MLVNGDQKTFSFQTNMFEGIIGFAVIETTDDAVIMARKDELLVAMEEDKAAKNLDLLFLAVVNIVHLHSSLLLCGSAESNLALASFKSKEYEHTTDPGVLDLGNMVSRKKDFIPPITRCIKAGYCV